MESRREHVNIDTTTCDPIVSMSKDKIGLKCVFFHKIGPLTQKGLLWREFCPLTVAKVQKGGFLSCQRLSKAVKVTAASNDCHPLKILEKGEEAYPVDGVLCRVFLTRNI